MLRNALQDSHPFVRKIGAAQTSVWSKNTIDGNVISLRFFVAISFVVATIVVEKQLIEQLYELLRDREGLVMVNSLNALNDIMPTGFVMNWNIVAHLINSAPMLDEWSQVQVVKLFSNFRVKNDQQMFGKKKKEIEKERRSDVSHALSLSLTLSLSLSLSFSLTVRYHEWI
jgi:hypothetical protein